MEIVHPKLHCLNGLIQFQRLSTSNNAELNADDFNSSLWHGRNGSLVARKPVTVSLWNRIAKPIEMRSGHSGPTCSMCSPLTRHTWTSQNENQQSQKSSTCEASGKQATKAQELEVFAFKVLSKTAWPLNHLDMMDRLKLTRNLTFVTWTMTWPIRLPRATALRHGEGHDYDTIIVNKLNKPCSLGDGKRACISYHNTWK